MRKPQNSDLTSRRKGEQGTGNRERELVTATTRTIRLCHNQIRIGHKNFQFAFLVRFSRSHVAAMFHELFSSQKVFRVGGQTLAARKR